MAYSVKSSAFKSISSQMTAPTNPSARSSVFQSSTKSGYKSKQQLQSNYSIQSGSRMLAPIKQDQQWARYKKKNED